MSTEAIRRIEEIKARADTFTLRHEDVPAICQALEIAVKALQDYRTMPRICAHNGLAAKTLSKIEEVLK